MSAELNDEAQLEIGHVLFMDIVGFSKLLVDQQSAFSDQLNRIVRNTEQFQAADAAGKLIRLPTGDGMVLVFFTSPEAPARCAVEIAKALTDQFGLRMGIHSGPVNKVVDVDGRSNVAGGGINTAQRVMDCGDAGHILLSRRVADDLAQYGRWRGQLHDLGEIEVKHGARIGIVNLYSDAVGNAQVPENVQLAQQQERKLRKAAARKRQRLAIAGVLAIAIIGLIAGYVLFRHGWSRQLDRSIAVLPFENLTLDKENAFFAGGIQDEILTNLAKIGDLKVISRTSVMRYAGSQQSVREIAKALGVTAVLEGTVRRVGSRVHISAQLINALNDNHIWAENYDRDITDVFGVQRDVALDIAATLHAKLSPNEKERLQRRPTSNGAAYLIYLHAQDAWWRAQSIEEAEKIAQLYEKAIALDPNFALAFAKLSYVEAIINYNRPSAASLEKARAAANEALHLQPDLPEAHFALGHIYFWGERNYERALTELEVAKAALPNDADVFAAIAAIQRKQGKWADSTKNHEKAAELNPKDATIWSMGLASTYWTLRDYSTAATMLDRAIAADPNFFHSHIWRAWLDIDSRGDIGPMEQLLAKTPESLDPDGVVTFARYGVKIFQRKFDEALAVLDKSTADCIEDQRAAPGSDCSKSFLRALAYRLKNDSANAHRYFEEARTALERKIEQNPTIGPAHASLGQIYAGLDRRDDAVREAKRAVELFPESQDALHGPHQTITIAQIHAMLGDADAALPLLEHLLSTPSGLTVALLELDPIWDPLRNDSRFQKLVR
jgi:TolB-like protein/class 3 adenylate cyclase/Tfp pilus assembly protein PilF